MHAIKPTFMTYAASSPSKVIIIIIIRETGFPTSQLRYSMVLACVHSCACVTDPCDNVVLSLLVNSSLAQGDALRIYKDTFEAMPTAAFCSPAFVAPGNIDKRRAHTRTQALMHILPCICMCVCTKVNTRAHVLHSHATLLAAVIFVLSIFARMEQ